MVGTRLLRFIVTFGMAFGMLLFGTQMAAASGTVTEGDAQSLLNTVMTGERAMRYVSGVTNSAPAQGFLRGLITPFNADGRHYCVDDWHLIGASWASGGDQTYTYQQAAYDLSGIIDTFVLDGAVFSIDKTTPVQQLVAPTVYPVAFGYAEGTVLSPSSLAVGKHRLSFKSVQNGALLAKNMETFYVDPSGSAACSG